MRVTQIRTYEADPAQLRREFPEEYQEFLKSSPADHSDRAWVMDCYGAAGLELFEFVESELEVG